jgi:NAD(P)-dependent dehydrogenase (short-subunit alcohol dehydrogenase family)
MALGRAGADICLVDVNEAGLADTADQLKALGVKTHIVATDLAQADNCHAAVASAVKTFGRLDALCNVAGVLVFCHAHEMTPADYQRTMAINLGAPFFLSQAAIPHLLERHGAIVNVSSTASYMGEAYAVAYCASKAGLTNMTKALAMEYMNKPIRINAVAPGGMATAIGRSTKLPEDADMSLVQRFMPVRGIVEVDDVAEMIAFLASDAARGYHGACVVIDNGVVAG